MLLGNAGYMLGTNRALLLYMTNEANKSDRAYASFAASILASYEAEIAFIASYEAIKARKAAKVASVDVQAEIATVRPCKG